MTIADAWVKFTDWIVRITDPTSEGWRDRRSRLVRRSKPTYEVYPLEEQHPRVRLVLISGRFWRPVDTDGYDLHELNWQKPWRRDWLMDRILEAFIDITKQVADERSAKAAAKEAAMKDEQGQGLVEYALILALIAVIAIIALLFLGGQISAIFSTLGNCLPNGGC